MKTNCKIKKINKQRERETKRHPKVTILIKNSYNRKNGNIFLQTSYKFSYILLN